MNKLTHTAGQHPAHDSPSALIWQLVCKDWHFVRSPMIAYVVLGLIAISLLAVEQQIVFYVGSVLLVSVVIVIGAHLVFGTVISERSQQTLPLVMSLPITYVQYSTAKLIANLGIFVLAWLALMASTLIVIATRDNIPDGLAPYAVIILSELFVGYILTLAVAMVSESEAWTIVTMTILNIGVSIFMFTIAAIPAIGDYMEGPAPVWNGTTVGIIGIEFLIITSLLGLTLVMQSRKTDFL